MIVTVHDAADLPKKVSILPLNFLVPLKGYCFLFRGACSRMGSFRPVALYGWSGLLQTLQMPTGLFLFESALDQSILDGHFFIHLFNQRRFISIHLLGF